MQVQGYGKDFFSLSQLSMQSLLWCLHSHCVQSPNKLHTQGFSIMHTI